MVDKETKSIVRAELVFECIHVMSMHQPIYLLKVSSVNDQTSTCKEREREREREVKDEKIRLSPKE